MIYLAYHISNKCGFIEEANVTSLKRNKALRHIMCISGSTIFLSKTIFWNNS